MKIGVWFGIILTVALPASTDDWTFDRYQWSGAIESGTAVEIINEHGDVRTRSSGINELEILANIQGAPDDPYEAVVRFGEGANPFAVEVIWELREGASVGDSTTEMEKRRVDLTVILPRTSSLTVRTVKGLIEAKGHGAAVMAESASGEIRVSTDGTVSARTDHGVIDAVLGRIDRGGNSTFETITGDITVWLPADAKATVEAETQGVISTDYSINIRRAEADGRKVVSANIGGGGPNLHIQTIRGQVRLFRLPK